MQTEELPMPSFVLLGLIAGATLLGTGPSDAFFRDRPSYQGPWCVIYNAGADFVLRRCDLPSFEACYIERANWGSTAFCTQNPRFLPEWSGPGAQPRKRKTGHRHRH
jgi:hypothetical protein